MAGTEAYGPFDSQPWADQTQWYRFGPAWAPSGVIDVPASSASTGSLALTFSGLTPTLSVGRAWVRGAGYELSGGSKTMAAIAANTNSSLSRRDRIVLRRDLSAKTVSLVPLTGTPASTPTAPALTQDETGQWDISLFSFVVPPNSGTTVTSITDERPWIDPNGGTLHQTRMWKFLRSSGNNSDPFSPGSFVSLISGTAAAAPAGGYLIITELSLSAAASASGNLRVTVAGTNASSDIKADLGTSAQIVHFSTTFAHTGGDLTVTAAFQSSQTATINTAGSQINVAYLGLQ